jgi:hypothetical protein
MLHQAKEGPWIPYVKPAASVSAAMLTSTLQTSVSFQATLADPSKSSLQNDTEDAVKMVQTDPLQPYRSPHIRHMLNTCAANVRAFNISSFLGPEGTSIALPPGGPPFTGALQRTHQCLPHRPSYQNGLLSFRYRSHSIFQLLLA